VQIKSGKREKRGEKSFFSEGGRIMLKNERLGGPPLKEGEEEDRREK